MLKVSVIIPTFRSWSYLSKCLEALENQSIPKDEFEILIINNDPKDVLPKDFVLPSNAKLFVENDPGSYSARNLGLELSKSQKIAFTDADCIPDPNWLVNGLRHLEDGADLVGGKVDFFKETEGDELTFLFEKTFNFKQKRNVEEKGQSITANLFCHKKVAEKIGPFKTKLLSGGDFEWTSRATSSGYKMVYGNDTLVLHPARKEFKSLVSKKRRTSGGMYYRFFQDFSNWEKLKFTMNILRPRISLLFRKEIRFNDRVKLFFVVWYLEWVGVKEMYLLAHQGKAAQRH